MFKKAVKHEAKLRLALVGPSGSGKTYTALMVARHLAGETGKVAVLDSEHGSAAKYADLFDFDSVSPDDHSPASYRAIINAAEKQGYTVVVIDSLSHAWMGKNGALELVDKAAARSKAGNSFTAWREVTPEHQRLIEAIVGSKIHVIATMRAKTEYVLEDDDRGKKTPRKIGLGPVQRDGVEYEFDVVGELDQRNQLVVTKSRCVTLRDYVARPASAEFAGVLRDWLAGAPESPAERESGPVLKDEDSCDFAALMAMVEDPATPVDAYRAALKDSRVHGEERRKAIEAGVKRYGGPKKTTAVPAVTNARAPKAGGT